MPELADPKYQEVTGISNSTYGDSSRIQFGFQSHLILINHRSGTNPIYFSFNGQDDHGVLHSGDGYIKSIEVPVVSSVIWFRGGTGDEIMDLFAFRGM